MTIHPNRHTHYVDKPNAEGEVYSLMDAYLRLEDEFSGWAHMKNTVACNSGTAALHLALEALKLPAGSKVIVPEYTFISSARAVTMAGLEPVFVDCDDNLLLDPDLLPKDDTDILAIMPVHVNGRYCDMERIGRYAKDYGLYVIEDCAQAHGINHTYESDAYCWSFYRNKIVAGEEGGMISFRHKSWADAARSMRSQGQTGKSNYLHNPRGHNYRLINSQAELILQSLHAAKRTLIHREQIVEMYDKKFPSEWQMPPRQVNWMYDIRLEGMRFDQLDEVIAILNKSRVAARHAFKPMSMQPEYLGEHKHLVAYRRAQEVLYLPINPAWEEYDVDNVVQKVTQAINHIW